MAQQITHARGRERFQPGNPRLAGSFRIPDLQGAGHISAVGAQEGDDVVGLAPDLLGQPVQEAALRQQLREETLSAAAVAGSPTEGKGHGDGENVGIKSEAGESRSIGLEVERSPVAGNDPDSIPVELDDKFSHRWTRECLSDRERSR